MYTRVRAGVRVFSARACASFVAALSGFTTECNGDSLPWSAVVLCWSHRIETDCAAVATLTPTDRQLFELCRSTN